MTHETSILEIIEKTTARRNARRAFMKTAVGGVAAVGGLSMLAACGDDDAMSTPFPTPTPTPAAVSTDVAVLNFALNLEYLEAQFYSYAAFGMGLPAASLTGTGTQGAVVTGSGAGFPRAVDFTGDPLIGQYAREIAYDEIAHVNFLRTALGSAAVAQPAINISGTADGAFSAAARAAGVITGATATFDPYLNPTNFLLGAYIFEDVGVTAYKGASPVISAMYLDAAAGILAAEAYHAGLVRTILYARGVTNRDLITAAQQISNLRDAADGTATGTLAGGTTPTAGSASPDGTTATAGDIDQGIGGTNIGVLATGVSNIVPTDVNGLAFSRSTQQVHNIVYLNATGANRTSGGFFPGGTNNPNPAFTVGLG
ncbi:ferritin-like domain-containing protein [Sphingomonas sp. Leaf37]|uniref:ferritin-like domain-containing protein n=1 Tax=Sphingomonas sp. Leaf37 TaxID=2876552 RepID=UPI001E4EAC42|nr:ferritin-like domain-containing protein [Sphingomonas sp. Leaf37]